LSVEPTNEIPPAGVARDDAPASFSEMVSQPEETGAADPSPVPAADLSLVATVARPATPNANVAPPLQGELRAALLRAIRALDIGGALLDPNGRTIADTTFARKLFEDCLVWVAQSFRHSAKDAPEALRMLDEGGQLARASASKSTLELLLRPEPDLDDLRRVERTLALLVDSARGKRTTVRHEWAMRIGFILLLLGSMAAVFIYSWLNPWRWYRFRASSAYSKYHLTGELGDSGPRELLFHTNEEQSPWVEVDLLTIRPIHKVVLKNRMDCCQERGVPLVVEMRAPDGTYWTVATREAPFDIWSAEFPEVAARYVRIRSLKRTILHLSAIEIR
jgi:hypothetical protein